MTELLNPAAMTKLSGDLKLTSNGTGSKTAKVTITARSGDPIDIPGFGSVVHDFSGMTSKSRIPLDKDHDQSDSIGYLNNFDTSTGDLVCSGAVVLTDPDNPDDDTTDLVSKILAGVPFEASIQTDDDMTLQFVPEGSQTVVNGNLIDGPVTVVTDWTLKAVAICKFGADSDTSTDLMLSANKQNEKSATPKEGFFIRFAKSKMGVVSMNESEKKVEAVEAKVEVAPVAAVEAVVKAPEVTQLSEVKVEAIEAPAEVAVEAKKDEAQGDAGVAQLLSIQGVTKTEVKTEEVAPITNLSKSNDPREEFKSMVSMFGAEKAANYFADGLSFNDALTKFSAAMKAENEDLKKRLAAVDRGAESPVRFSKVDTESVKGSRTAKPAGQGLSAIVTLANKK